MMLEKPDDNPRRSADADPLSRYLTSLLRTKIELSPTRPPTGLPIFLTRIYKVYQTQIIGRPCLFLLSGDTEASSGDVAKHVRRFQEASGGAIVVYSPPTMNARNRARLIEAGVAFAVPGNQLFVPDLAIDLREHFRAARTPDVGALSPAAQVLLFKHLLGLEEMEASPGRLALETGYSPMTIGRAFDDLVAAGAAQSRKTGRERRLTWTFGKRELFELLSPRLRSPVRKTRHIMRLRFNMRPAMHVGGEMALSEYTNLASPRIETWAMPSAGWKSFVRQFEFEEVDMAEAEIAIETWAYDPANLSATWFVDPLSLHVQYRNHADERVAQAAQRLLEKVRW